MTRRTRKLGTSRYLHSLDALNYFQKLISGVTLREFYSILCQQLLNNKANPQHA